MAYFHTTVLDNQIKALPTVSTASGSIATFDTDMTENLIEVVCDIQYQQAEGTPTPVNPLLITTFSEMNVIQMSDITNKVYFDGLLNGTYGFVDLGTLTWTKVTYTSVTAGMYFYASMPDRAVGNTNMICSNYFVPDIKGLSNIIAEYGSDVDNILFTTNTTSRANIVDSDYTDENDLAAALNGVYLIYELATPRTPTITKAQFETLLTAFGIDGSLYNISFGQTVAKGTLNVTTGVLEITKAMSLIIGLSWNYDSANSRFNTQALQGIIENAQSTTTPLDGLTCECYANDVSSSSRQIDLSIAVNTSGIMFLKDTNYTDVTSLLSAVGNYKIVYPLATPLTIQLSATQITALLNENNIWCDTGDTEVKYLLTVGKKIS